MDVITYILIFIFGTIVGSFLNVVVLRSYTGMTLQGRSRCFSCNTTLTWVDLIPVISYTCLRGKCRTCSTGISAQYPLVEITTGLLFVSVFYVFPINSIGAISSSFGEVSMGIFLSIALTLVHLIIACLMVLITAYDIKHKIIPNGWVYSFIVLAAVAFFLKLGTDSSLVMSSWDENTWVSLISWLVSGPVVAAPCFLIWLFSKGRAMGFADSKLSWGIGWVLGISAGISAFAIAVWVGAALSVAIVVYYKYYVGQAKKHDGSSSVNTKHLSMKSEIPFAPYLIIGMYITLLFNLDLFHLDFFVNYLGGGIQ